MNLKIKLLNENARLPAYQSGQAGGLDLVATSKEWDEVNGVLTFGTGLAIQLPRGTMGLLMPRSSIYKTGLTMCNGIGLLDSDYSGEVMFKFYVGRAKSNFSIGDRIGQLVVIPIPYMNIQVVSELTSTERNEGGFGSTGV